MKITQIETIPVNVPLKKGMTAKTAHGEHATSPYVIVRVHTDEGLIGLGEANISGLWTGETQASTVAAIREYIEPVVLGKDPRDIQSIRQAMDFIIKLNPFTKAAVEMALWDIAGKSAGVPVYQLLGGQVRDKVRIKLVVWARDIAGSR
ncbi:MAG: mandelate racemase/muconate lactonizing protein, partial [Planctomycetales bacterium]|nr:mandelate racemase/muconate lactonizing protein [Planctomycetales bacterium]